MEEERKQMTDEERQYTLLEYWAQMRNPKPNPLNTSPELLRSVDIFDQLSETEEIPLPVINQFMLEKGFTCTTVADGSVRWVVY